jgi:hypothetical protein
VDSSPRVDAVTCGDAANALAVKPGPEGLCTAACKAVFPGENSAKRQPLAVFHAQVIDFNGERHGHIFAMFSEAPVFRGVERMPHKAMHSVIHRLCG